MLFRSGAHHCLSPEPRRIVIQEREGELIVREQPSQSMASITRLLGYPAAPRRAPAALPAPTTRLPLRFAPLRSVSRRFVRQQRHAA